MVHPKKERSGPEPGEGSGQAGNNGTSSGPGGSHAAQAPGDPLRQVASLSIVWGNQ